MNESLAIFIDNIDAHDQNELENILATIRSKYISDDYFIFTDFFVQQRLNHWSILSTFHMKFFKGKVVFLDEKSYLKHKDNTLAKSFLHKEILV